MKSLIRNLAWAFWYDEKAVKRWIRGAAFASVPTVLQLVSDPTWPTWTFKQWGVKMVPGVLGFIGGSIQSSATKAPPKPGTNL